MNRAYKPDIVLRDKTGGAHAAAGKQLVQRKF